MDFGRRGLSVVSGSYSRRQRSGAGAARWAHNPKVAGSIPASATTTQGKRAPARRHTAGGGSRRSGGNRPRAVESNHIEVSPRQVQAGGSCPDLPLGSAATPNTATTRGRHRTFFHLPQHQQQLRSDEALTHHGLGEVHPPRIGGGGGYPELWLTVVDEGHEEGSAPGELPMALRGLSSFLGHANLANCGQTFAQTLDRPPMARVTWLPCPPPRAAPSAHRSTGRCGRPTALADGSRRSSAPRRARSLAGATARASRRSM